MAYYHTLFYFDIETTTKYKDINELSSKDEFGYRLFAKKFNKYKWYPTIEESYIKRAPLMAEHNKIINVSFCYFNNDELKIKSICDDDEETLLKSVDKILTNANSASKTLCGFNIKNFDIPVLNKKYYKYGIKMPHMIETYNKKPWELRVEDIIEIWKSSGQELSSFDEVCYVLGVESSKIKMDGSNVYEQYWIKNDLKSVKDYCEGELYAMVQVAEKIFKHTKRPLI